ncbi:mobilization protein [Marinifilum breve]|uniref:Mobilization protein n=1 Tax=Marinifilum breve TaxID=2184082 RepID=A0A2V3ZZC7_9BACT|nr:plasmid mobilization relaxosome protein MobC [Marinifilum breve]PXY01643.1 mobilization protein [Marinifilum breve]
MARPRKIYEDLRLYQVSVRLTKKENEIAREQAELASQSVANWLRNSAFSKKQYEVTTTPMHKAYYRQLTGVANNINQITKKLNQNKYSKISAEIQEVRELLLKIYNLFQK